MTNQFIKKTNLKSMASFFEQSDIPRSYVPAVDYSSVPNNHPRFTSLFFQKYSNPLLLLEPPPSSPPAYYFFFEKI